MAKQTQTIYTFDNLINGRHGNALKALALTTVNFELSRQIAQHPQLKMPVSRPSSPDDLRDAMTLPEFEGRSSIQKLDVLLDGLVATCALIKDVASTTDYDAAGRLTRPFAWIIDRCRTPISAVTAAFEWRADMAAKVAGEQAQMLGVKDAKDIEAKARERAMAQNEERMNYALAEVNSNTTMQLMTEDEVNLIDLLLDLNQKTYDGLRLVHQAAQNEMTRARKRLEAGLYTTVDPEVILFAKSALPDVE